MPTTKQLQEIWMAELAMPGIRRTDDPMYVPPKLVEHFSGAVIGKISIDTDTKDIKIEVDEE